MKKLVVFIFAAMSVSILASFFSCEGLKPEILEVPKDTTTVAVPKLELSASRSTAAVFEMIDFTLSANGTGSTYLDYDSIIWKIPNVLYRKTVPPHFLIGLQQSFCDDGDYDIHIHGYKEGKISSGDTVKIKITRAGNFLSINWNNSNTPSRFFDYVGPDRQYALGLFHQRRDTIHALLNHKVLNAVDENDSMQRNLQGRQILFDYIKKHYGNPALKYDGSDIANSPLSPDYASRFLMPLDSIDRKYDAQLHHVYIPVAIWDNTTSHIALLGTVDTGGDPNTYFKVIAEPRKE